jgi:hypothetical protein
MRNGYSGAYSAGAYIGQGLANGMNSMLGTVRSIAASLASAANAAIAAKAKIGSPSKITTQYGKWIGEGLGNGISDMTSAVSGKAKALATSVMSSIDGGLDTISISALGMNDLFGSSFVSGLQDDIDNALSLVSDAISSVQSKTDGMVFSFAEGSSAISGEYKSEQDNVYQFEISVPIDGREVAKATVEYTEDELETRRVRTNRKSGRR